MKSDDKKHSEQADTAANQEKGADLERQLTDFALKMFANRKDENQWQVILEAAPSQVVSFLSGMPELLSKVLAADSEETVKNIINESLSLYQASGNNQDTASTEEPTTTAESKENEAEVKSEIEQVESTKKSNVADTDQAQDDEDTMASGDDEAAEDAVCTDQELVDFLRNIYTQKEEVDGLSKLLSSTDSTILNRLDQNPFYITEVLQIANENDLNVYLDTIVSNIGPLSSESVETDQSVIDENINYLLSNWAYINFDGTLTNTENQEVINSGLLDGQMQWISDAGVPVNCMSSTEQENVVTVALSMHGALQGFNPDVSVDTGHDSIEPEVSGLDESLQARQMIAAYDLISFVKAFEMQEIRVRSGHRNLLRNFWAIAKINGLACAGFEPTPEELQWYDKRELTLQNQFTYQHEHELELTASMTPMGTSTGAIEAIESTTEDMLGSDADDKSTQGQVDTQAQEVESSTDTTGSSANTNSGETDVSSSAADKTQQAEDTKQSKPNKAKGKSTSKAKTGRAKKAKKSTDD